MRFSLYIIDLGLNDFGRDAGGRIGCLGYKICMIYVIGDLHLSLSTDKPMDKFGEEWKNHHEKIKADWLKKVKEDDIVMLAGDTSWAMRYDEALVDFRWIDELPGKKLIIKGNHDYWWNYRSALAKEYRSIHFINSNCYEYGRYAIVGTRGWDFPEDGDEANKKIYRRELIRLENSLKSVPENRIIIGMIHYPPVLNGEATEFTELFEKYGVKKVYYGHLHSKYAFEHAYTGRLNRIDYELISCDYTDFKLVVAAEGSAVDVDRTDFFESSSLLEERRLGISMLESSCSLDKSGFIDFNFELARRIAKNFTGGFTAGRDSSDDDTAQFKDCLISSVFRNDGDGLHLMSELKDELETELFLFVEEMVVRDILSVADGLIKYNFINSLAKWQMSFADRFEFSDISKCRALRKIAYRLYEFKDRITLGICRHLLLDNVEIDYYRIHLRSERLNGKIFEIVSVPDERIVMHTTSEEVVDLLRESGLPEKAMRDSMISSYVNVKMY